ncbi:MAG: ATP-binding protein [Candidatus Hydrothermia bacterium]
MIKLVPRWKYIKALERFEQKPLIKVITGLRRVGKTSILRIFRHRLLEKGIPEENIIFINKESKDFEHIQTDADLFKYVQERFKNTSGSRYLIIDEVQLIKHWEKAVLSIHTDNTADIYITGSNSELLPVDVATRIRGRTVEIRVYPLTFKEFLEFRGTKENIDREFQYYLKYGGIPMIHHLPLEDEEQVFKILESILHTVFFKDILERYKLKDPFMLELLLRFAFENIGNITSARSISRFLKSQKIERSVDTILNYIQYMKSAFLIDGVKRFGLQGRRILEYGEKIYPADIGLRHAMTGYEEGDISGLLECIVYSELRYRGYNVFVGETGNHEVDFVCQKGKKTVYIQVAYMLENSKTIDREFGNLLEIRDNYPKYVISLSKFFPKTYKGITHIYLLDFLLEEEEL